MTHPSIAISSDHLSLSITHAFVRVVQVHMLGRVQIMIMGFYEFIHHKSVPTSIPSKTNTGGTSLKVRGLELGMDVPPVFVFDGMLVGTDLWCMNS
ncbi:unnamed protein product [Linum trigynum]|uniref:Uncharacterized protein n=1 Tax=Linum trigynum TaxID=586398 RepID=A0AAV2G604_9ROSI